MIVFRVSQLVTHLRSNRALSCRTLGASAVDRGASFIARQVRRRSDAERPLLRSVRPPNDTIPATAPTPRGRTWVEEPSHHHLGARAEAAGDNSLVPHHPSLTWKTDRMESIHRSWNQRWGLGEAAAARAVHSAIRPRDPGFHIIEPRWNPGRFTYAGTAIGGRPNSGDFLGVSPDACWRARSQGGVSAIGTIPTRGLSCRLSV